MSTRASGRDDGGQARGVAYQPFYCEENIWQLAGDARLAGRRCRVAVISNGERACPLWQQRAAPPGEAVCWDYHVILLAEGCLWEVWDLDTRLGCPVPATVWVEATFPGADGWAARWLPRFRVMTAGEYRRRLSSDRSHMRDESGGFRQPPPPWPPIYRTEAGMNLPALIDPDRPGPGRVMDLGEFRRTIEGGG